MGKMLPFSWRRPALVFATFLVICAQIRGQSGACRAVEPHPLGPAEKAYSDGFYAQAEQLYTQALAEHPQDGAVSARLVETLLHQDKLAQAVQQVQAAVTASPKSA